MRRLVNASNRDYCGGALMVVIGLGGDAAG